jgi:hypothetical protein
MLWWCRNSPVRTLFIITALASRAMPPATKGKPAPAKETIAQKRKGAMQACPEETKGNHLMLKELIIIH